MEVRKEVVEVVTVTLSREDVERAIVQFAMTREPALHRRDEWSVEFANAGSGDLILLSARLVANCKPEEK